MLNYLVKLGDIPLNDDTYINSYSAYVDQDVYEWQDANYDRHRQIRSRKVAGSWTMNGISETEYHAFVAALSNATVTDDDGAKRVYMTAYIPEDNSYHTFYAFFESVNPVMQNYILDGEAYYESINVAFREV